MSDEFSWDRGGSQARVPAASAEDQRRWAPESEPPAAVWLPRLTGPDTVLPDAVEYPLIVFPQEPWTLTALRQLTEPLAATAADWLNQVGPGRLPVITAVLQDAGLPAAGLRERPERLLELGSSIQRWFGLIAGPLLEQRFFYDDPEDRLGQAYAAWGPPLARYSRYGDALLHSLAVDISLVVADCARAVRPGLRWQAAFHEWNQDYFVTVDPDPPVFELVRQVQDFLVQSLARPRGGRGAQLRRWHGQTLFRCYQRGATGVAPAEINEEFPDLRTRMDERYRLSRPKRSDPAAPRELTDAAAAFRQAGWFETARLEPPELAQAAQAAWRAFEREDIPLSDAEIAWRLLLLDVGRTWSEDVDADVRPGDGLYEATLFAIEKIGGKGFGRFRDPEEDWTSSPGDLVLSFWWGRRQQRLLIPSPGPYLSPALIRGLDSHLPADGQHLWFFDHGAPLAIVSRATAGERAALEQLTGIRLDADPPRWWSALSSRPPG